jgi:hypothetical protein
MGAGSAPTRIDRAGTGSRAAPPGGWGSANVRKRVAISSAGVLARSSGRRGPETPRGHLRWLGHVCDWGAARGVARTETRALDSSLRRAPAPRAGPCGAGARRDARRTRLYAAAAHRPCCPRAPPAAPDLAWRAGRAPLAAVGALKPRPPLARRWRALNDSPFFPPRPRLPCCGGVRLGDGRGRVSGAGLGGGGGRVAAATIKAGHHWGRSGGGGAVRRPPGRGRPVAGAALGGAKRKQRTAPPPLIWGAAHGAPRQCQRNVGASLIFIRPRPPQTRLPPSRRDSIPALPRCSWAQAR